MSNISTKPTADFSSFAALDIRVGKVIAVEDSLATKPTYRLTVDLGPQIGIKKSCGAYRNYTKEFLTGKLVIGVVNFAPKKMGPEISEVLILGVQNAKGETIFLTPEQEVTLGEHIF